MTENKNEIALERLECLWCGWIGELDELDFDEHDVPAYCPECGHRQYKFYFSKKKGE